MKKVAFLMICCVYVINCSAQHWGVRGGLNISNASSEIKAGKGISVSEDSKNKVGFRIGIVALGETSKVLSFQPGLYLTTLGVKSKPKGNPSMKEVDNMYYLQMPLLASINVALKNKSQKWQILFGPYVSYGIGGKAKMTKDGETVSIKLFKKLDSSVGLDKAILNRFDAGLSFGTGFLLRKIFVGVNYDLGLTNIMNDDLGKDLKVKNRNFTIAFGVNF